MEVFDSPGLSEPFCLQNSSAFPPWVISIPFVIPPRSTFLSFFPKNFALRTSSDPPKSRRPARVVFLRTLHASALQKTFVFGPFGVLLPFSPENPPTAQPSGVWLEVSPNRTSSSVSSEHYMQTCLRSTVGGKRRGKNITNIIKQTRETHETIQRRYVGGTHTGFFLLFSIFRPFTPRKRFA